MPFVHQLKQLLTKEIFGEKEIIIIDCRYMYEYVGGHIESAVNVTDPVDIETMFFSAISQECFQSNVQRENLVIIFHCEFSQKRGPKM